MSTLAKFIILVVAMIFGSLLAYFPLGGIGASASIAIKAVSIAFIFFCIYQLEYLSKKLESENVIKKRVLTNIGKIIFFGSWPIIAVGFFIVLDSMKYGWSSTPTISGVIMISTGIGMLLLTPLLVHKGDIH